MRPLIITRPQPAADISAARARQMGLDARVMPLFAAEPLDWAVPDLSAFDALFISSAQALRLGGAGLGALHGLPTYAVGAATAKAATAAGFAIAGVGDSDGQTLIEQMEAADIRSILWLCGQEHSQITPQQARLTPLPCYHMAVSLPPADWAHIITRPAILTAYSSRAAQRLDQLLPANRAHLILAAISQKVADAAGANWGVIKVAEKPDDASILALAEKLCHKAHE